MSVSGYAAWSVVASEQPTTSKWNILGSNDAAFNTYLTATNNIITPNMLALNPQVAATASSSTTTSNSYGNLADGISTSVTVTIGVNGLALVMISSESFQSTNSDFCFTSYSMSGANTAAATGSKALIQKNSGSWNDIKASLCHLETGLTAGSTTFTLQYAVNAGTGAFSNRDIAVIPL
jgi:hypothetical protein